MSEIVLTGRGLVGGVAEAEALVTRHAISGWGGVEPRTGRIIESRHELVGRSFAGKVLVFPGAKGSSGWSGMFHMARLVGSAPAAMVFTVMNTKIALGVVVSHVPAVTDLDGDPFEVIRTGDRVRVDGDRGTIIVTRADTYRRDPEPSRGHGWAAEQEQDTDGRRCAGPGPGEHG
jgi:predicted aconitase with swiveling domain